MKNTFKKALIFSKSNSYLVIFFILQLLILSILAFRFYIQPTKYIYAKVKVSQGLWWAATAKPPAWINNSLKKGASMKDSFGKTSAQIVTVRNYPTWTQNQYDIYFIVKLKVSYNDRTDEYTFNRTTIAVGAPIEFSFSSTEIAGTIMNVSEHEIKDEYVDKTITLVNKQGYTKDYPFFYNQIKIHDRYYNGEENVLEVLDKSLQKNIWTVANNLNADVYEKEIESIQNIILKLKIKTIKRGNMYYYAEEYPMIINSTIPLSTNNISLNDFKIVNIE